MQETYSKEESTIPSFERPIDLVHLARQTYGDRNLEQEVLNLFLFQLQALIEKLGKSENTQQKKDISHTLKGSARSIGAWRVAAEAEECEKILDEANIETKWNKSFNALKIAGREAVDAITQLKHAA